jgi:hypothetical protein
MKDATPRGSKPARINDRPICAISAPSFFALPIVVLFHPFAASGFRPYTPFDRLPFSGAIHFYSCTFRIYRGRFKGYKSDRRN